MNAQTHAHILLVDDDPDLLRLLTIRLKAGNYRVTAVGSAEAISSPAPRFAHAGDQASVFSGP